MRADVIPLTTSTDVDVFVLATESGVKRLRRLAREDLPAGPQGPPALPPTMRVYSANDTWTKPANLVAVLVKVIGGGGGGGGNLGSDFPISAGGGGAGGNALKYILAASLNATEAVTVGAGGPGSLLDQPGSDGGASSFGAHVSATGGTGGAFADTTASAYSILGGEGGLGSGGDINGAGAPGGNGQAGLLNYTVSGDGGSTELGGGGRGVGNGAGNPGRGPGAGGSGSAEKTGADNTQPGGDGDDGVVIVWEYTTV